MSKVTKKVRRTYEEVQGFKCDYCQEFMQCGTLTLSFGFGCDKDLSPDEHYCSYECLGKAYEKYVRKSLPPDYKPRRPIPGFSPPPVSESNSRMHEGWVPGQGYREQMRDTKPGIPPED